MNEFPIVIFPVDQFKQLISFRPNKSGSLPNFDSISRDNRKKISVPAIPSLLLRSLCSKAWNLQFERDWEYSSNVSREKKFAVHKAALHAEGGATTVN